MKDSFNPTTREVARPPAPGPTGITTVQWFGIVISVLAVIVMILAVLIGLEGALAEPNWLRSQGGLQKQMAWGFGIAFGALVVTGIGFLMATTWGRRPTNTIELLQVQPSESSPPSQPTLSSSAPATPAAMPPGPMGERELTAALDNLKLRLAEGRISEATYLELKGEFERRLEESRGSSAHGSTGPP